MKKFDGGYDRVGVIEVKTETCNMCEKVGQCLVIDGSDGEYDTAPLCRQCITALFVEAE